MQVLTLSPVSASTVRQFSVEELVDYADLIFQGSVAYVRSEEIDGLVYSFARFDVEEVIKGDDPGAQVELRFLGGEVAGNSVEVAGMAIPVVGEQGIYFVDSLQGNIVNPLLGWTQGAFPIAGEGVMEDAEGRVAAAVTGQGQDVLAEKLATMGFRDRAEAEKARYPAISPERFKALIYRLLEAR